MRALAFSALLTGCAGLQAPFPSKTTDAARVQEIGSPTSVEFDMLGTASGKACDSLENLALLEKPHSVDPATIGPPALYERAKYEAVISAKGADGIVGVTAKSWLEGANVCTMLAGRAYRIRAMRIGPPMNQPGGGAKLMQLEDAQ